MSSVNSVNSVRSDEGGVMSGERAEAAHAPIASADAARSKVNSGSSHPHSSLLTPHASRILLVMAGGIGGHMFGSGITRAAHALACTENVPCGTPFGGLAHG